MKKARGAGGGEWTAQARGPATVNHLAYLRGRWRDGHAGRRRLACSRLRPGAYCFVCTSPHASCQDLKKKK